MVLWSSGSSRDGAIVPCQDNTELLRVRLDIPSQLEVSSSLGCCMLSCMHGKGPLGMLLLGHWTGAQPE